MYTVGLISSKTDVIRTFSYSTLEEARKELNSWKNVFKLNNIVNKSTTIVERDELDKVVSVKIIFSVEHKSESYIMFMCKNS